MGQLSPFAFTFVLLLPFGEQPIANVDFTVKPVLLYNKGAEKTMCAGMSVQVCQKVKECRKQRKHTIILFMLKITRLLQAQTSLDGL